MALDPDALVATSFPTVRRGADPDAVKRLLTTVAGELRQLRATEAELQAALAAVADAAPAELDEAQVTELLGQETARVLGAAREAAAEIRAKAAERAERLERDAEAEAARVRADADAVAARRREQADADVDAARAEAAGVRADAEAEAQRRREEVDAEVQARRSAVAERELEAADEATRLRAEAEADAAQLRAEAEADAAQLRADAEAEATRAAAAGAAERAAFEAETTERRAAVAAEDERRRAEADAALQQRRDEADDLARDAAARAAATIEEAKAEGRRLVIDAQAVRERVLADMERRRGITRDQIELLQAGRDRLVAAYGFVRASLDEVSEELRVAVEEADELLGDDEAAASAGASSGSMSLGELDDERAGDDVIARLQELAAVPSSDLPTTQAVPALDAVDLRSGGDAASDAAAEVAPEVVADAPVGEEVAAGEVGAPDGPPAGGADLLEPPGPAPDDALDEPVELDRPDEPDDGPIDGVVSEPEPDEGIVIATGPAAPAVEALFARIRASRAEVVAKAQELLEADGAVQVEVDPARAWVAERAAVLDPVERALGRRLKRALADEESGVLDVLRRQRSAQLEELIGSADEHASRVRGAVQEHLVEAVAAGEAFSRALGDDVRSVDPGPRLLDPVLDELVADLVAPLRARVAAAVSETGGSTDDLAAPLRALYREWKTQRLDRAASHAALSAFGAGALAALVPGTPVRWAVEPAEGACPDGEDNALAGVQPAGEAFPTGHRHAPAHSTCRCQVVPADHR